MNSVAYYNTVTPTSSLNSWVAAIVTIALLLWSYIRRKNEKDKGKGDKLPYPPGPKPEFFYGNTRAFPDRDVGYHGDKLLEWSIEYGLFFRFQLFCFPGIIVADPEFAKHVLISKNYKKSNAYSFYFKEVIGQRSLLALNGKLWAPRRKAFCPGFGPNFLRTSTHKMTQKLQRVIDWIDEDVQAGLETNTLEKIETFAADVIVSVAFGEDWGGSEPHPAKQWQKEISREIRHYSKLLDAKFRSILDWHLEESDKRDDSDDAASEKQHTDICSIAIDHFKELCGGTISEYYKGAIIDQLKTFHFAGHETTASIISWTLWSLSKYDDVATKLRSELQENGIWSNGLGEPPSYDAITQLPYLDAVIKENLRLYPPAVTSRWVHDGEETYKGYRIGKCVINLCPYAMHRHPKLWNKPEEFRPERFLDGSETNLNDKFIPFMRGPRDCMGKYFALLEAKLAVSAIVLRYDLECVDPNESIKFFVTTVPRNGAKVKFTKRAKWGLRGDGRRTPSTHKVVSVHSTTTLRVKGKAKLV